MHSNALQWNAARGARAGKAMRNKDRYDATVAVFYNRDLRACPFCGGEAEMARTHTRYWWVECLDCGSEIGSVYGARRAFKKWNERVLP